MRRLGSMFALLLALALALLIAACGNTAGHDAPRASAATHTRSTQTATRAGSGQHHHRPVFAVSQRGWRRHPGPVPILVYHELGTPPASEPWPGLYVSDAVFRSEITWLHRQGYEAVTLDQVMTAWYHHGLLPKKPIVITFDNGYPPQVYFAPRVMARYHWPGVLNYIVEGHVGPAAIRHVLRMGWEVDSHSLTHPDLTELAGAALRAQVTGSRQILRRRFHIPVDSFCYPSSRYDAAVIAAVKAAGYTNATTENAGYATRQDPYELDRFEIEAGIPELAADLAEPH